MLEERSGKQPPTNYTGATFASWSKSQRKVSIATASLSAYREKKLGANVACDHLDATVRFHRMGSDSSLPSTKPFWRGSNGPSSINVKTVRRRSYESASMSRHSEEAMNLFHASEPSTRKRKSLPTIMGRRGES